MAQVRGQNLSGTVAVHMVPAYPVRVDRVRLGVDHIRSLDKTDRSPSRYAVRMRNLAPAQANPYAVQNIQTPSKMVDEVIPVVLHGHYVTSTRVGHGRLYKWAARYRVESVARSRCNAFHSIYVFS